MKLFFHKLGNGPPAIILHGLFGSSDNWMTLARKLAGDFAVTLPDLRNHGRSPHSNDFHLAGMASDLHELIEAEQIRMPCLIGHSLGGKVAMHYSLARPAAVSGLIVVDISPVERKRQGMALFSDFLLAMRSLDLGQIETRQQADQLLSERIDDLAIRQFLLKNLYRRSDQSFDWRLNLEGIANNLEAVGQGIVAEAPYPNRALFIRGETSPYIQSDDETRIRELFPLAEIMTVPGAGHWVHAEAPEAVLNMIKAFLA